MLVDDFRVLMDRHGGGGQLPVCNYVLDNFFKLKKKNPLAILSFNFAKTNMRRNY